MSYEIVHSPAPGPGRGPYKIMDGRELVGSFDEWMIADRCLRALQGGDHLRDRIAIAAMQAILTARAATWETFREETMPSIAYDAYVMADAMMKARMPDEPHKT